MNESTPVTTTPAPGVPLGYEISQKATFRSSDGQTFTLECTNEYTVEMTEKSQSMIPVVNDRIRSQVVCPGKTIDDLQMVSASVTFLTDASQVRTCKL